MAKSEEERIILKPKPVFMGVGVFLILAAIFLIWLVFTLPSGDAGVLGLIFCCLFAAAMMGIGLFAFVTNAKRITICGEGVSCRLLLREKRLAWSEIAAWGLSYWGETRWEGATYILCFSSVPCKIKGDGGKRPRGKKIKTYVLSREYAYFVNEVIPFCRARTAVEPYLEKDRAQFWK